MKENKRIPELLELQTAAWRCELPCCVLWLPLAVPCPVAHVLRDREAMSKSHSEWRVGRWDPNKPNGCRKPIASNSTARSSGRKQFFRSRGKWPGDGGGTLRTAGCCVVAKNPLLTVGLGRVRRTGAAQAERVASGSLENESVKGTWGATSAHCMCPLGQVCCRLWGLGRAAPVWLCCCVGWHEHGSHVGMQCDTIQFAPVAWSVHLLTSVDILVSISTYSREFQH